MKKLVDEITEEGLGKLLGNRITLFCANYIYTGELIFVNDIFILLKNPAIVYETGDLMKGGWQNSQPLPKEWYINISAVESFGILK